MRTADLPDVIHGNEMIVVQARGGPRLGTKAFNGRVVLTAEPTAVRCPGQYCVTVLCEQGSNSPTLLRTPLAAERVRSNELGVLPWNLLYAPDRLSRSEAGL